MSDIKFSFPKNPTKSGELQISYMTEAEFSLILKRIDSSLDIVKNLHAYSFLFNKWKEESDLLFDDWLPECYGRLVEIIVSITGRNDTGVLSVKVYLEYMRMKGWIL